ncbi:hypothetical protein ACPPVU_09310 [Mucilaginibacter sp. McL0603]|uniref:hypothetical protein n=1 Tax=Mucilaginibacter sp. McL0603 TaxID=3415670 RepID=UPI003CEDA563
MKNLIQCIAVMSSLLLFSCTKTIYTHEQVLDMYQTKASVSKKFGTPTERKVSDSTEQWLYQYEKSDPFNRHVIGKTPNTKTVDVADFNRYDRYLIFTFDKNGNVIRNDFKGVNLAVKKANTVGTVLLVTGIVGVVLGATAIIYNSTDTYYGIPFTE